MDISDTFEKKNQEIKRKTKIQYRKIKGRLNQKGSGSGFLNKSVCLENVRKQLNESAHNSSQLVSVKNINAFLEKNRDLAKALQDARCELQGLEKEKFASQMECIQMRAKLNISRNAILKCSCKQNDISADNGSFDLLNNVKESISQSQTLFTEYLDSLAIQDYNEMKMPVRYPPNCMLDKETQTDEIFLADTSTQTKIIITKNKRLQVTQGLGQRVSNVHIQEEQVSKECVDKTTQTEKTRVFTNKMVQCTLLEDTNVENKRDLTEKLYKIAKRIPLATITGNQPNQSPKPAIKNDKISRSILKPNRISTIKPFQIYRDNSNENEDKKTNRISTIKPSFEIYTDNLNEDKLTKPVIGRIVHKDESKKVRIYSPAEIHLFEDKWSEGAYNLRSRLNRPTYTDIDGKKKLIKGDRGVDLRSCSPNKFQKKKKRKKRKASTKALRVELVTSLLEESLLAISLCR